MSLRRYETNERQPTMQIITRMAAALGLTVGEFLWNEGSNLHRLRAPLSNEMLKRVGFQDILSYLGYEIETTEIPEDEQVGLINAGYELEDDGSPDIVWIRDIKGEKCYQVTWEQIHTLNDEICNFSEFMAKKLISSSKVIKRPNQHYAVNFSD